MTINPSDRGLLLADGLFETLRIENHRPLLLTRHLQRLQSSCRTLAIPYVEADICQAVENAIAPCSDGPYAMRLTITRGPGPRGLLPPETPKPTILTAVSPANPRDKTIVRAALATTQRNAGSPASSMKSLQYLDNILARQEAGPDRDDAIMLNTAGLPACTTIGNILVRRDDGWVTPPTAIGGVLPGIVRAVLIESGRVREDNLSTDDLFRFPLARSNSLTGVQAMTLPCGVPSEPEAAWELTQVLETAEAREL
ncbi:MAG: aminotransferase class IV [Pseudomonadota bacterium]